MHQYFLFTKISINFFVNLVPRIIFKIFKAGIPEFDISLRAWFQGVAGRVRTWGLARFILYDREAGLCLHMVRSVYAETIVED